jgi:hypothetical protein
MAVSARSPNYIIDADPSVTTATTAVSVHGGDGTPSQGDCRAITEDGISSSLLLLRLLPISSRQPCGGTGVTLCAGASGVSTRRR